MLLDPQVRSLQFAARPRVVCRYLGELFLPLAVLLVVPLAVWVAEMPAAAWGWLAGVVIALAVIATVLARLEGGSDLQRNEALVVIALAFAIAPALLTLPLVAAGLPWVDALFQSVSGITTTGLSTLAPRQSDDFAFHFYCAWMQWTGGLGVVVLALAFLVSPGPALRRLGVDERETESLAGGTRAHARFVLVVYATLSIVAFLALLVGLDASSALLHALTAVSTGGFSPHAASAGAIDGAWPRAALAGASLCSAISFAFYYRGLHRRPRVLLEDEGLRALLALVVLACACVWLLQRAGGAPLDIGDAAFVAVSAQTTTGFSTVDVQALAPASKLVLIGSMLIGGDVGSTAGGLKILRLLIVVRLVELVLARASVASGARLLVRVEGRRVTPREVELAVALLVAHLSLVAASWLAFLAAGQPPLDSLFEVVSAVSLTGLSSGIAAPDLAAGLKLVLCLDMLAGRVEILALLIVLYPGTWFGKRRDVR